MKDRSPITFVLLQIKSGSSFQHVHHTFAGVQQVSSQPQGTHQPLQLFQGVNQKGQAESKGTTGKTHLHHPLKNNSANTALNKLTSPSTPPSLCCLGSM